MIVQYDCKCAFEGSLEAFAFQRPLLGADLASSKDKLILNKQRYYDKADEATRHFSCEPHVELPEHLPGASACLGETHADSGSRPHRRTPPCSAHSHMALSINANEAFYVALQARPSQLWPLGNAS
jgi:hypothetical protein